MPTPASYSWAMTLQNAVPIGDGITMPTPGMTNPQSYDTAGAQVVYGGEVLQDDEFTLEWASDFSSVFIVNESDEEWPVQDTIALAVSGVPFDPSDLQDAFTQIEARLVAVENRSTVNETRLTALEANVSEMQQTLYDPQVAEQDINISIGQVVVGTPILQMYAVHAPTAWAITYEKKNGNATGGFWTIDNDGWISATNGAVASVKVNDVIEVGVQATNDFGSGDGVWNSTVWP